ncbi:hypothetical protein TSACC_2888 [Terrimicrobium sacchariphilum]|uniref:Uncharacterized protein n=1 Tax=Terrimicrobium sacchariphilum TaxID=690879 RepID=A0A146G3T3_TERSA|nr:hypothetical protein [Terrimicrobium sacchariphilum]GAT32489.1 hypothetical protein TSACC_2888 [Terrimicrobium sacchariphilum]
MRPLLALSLLLLPALSVHAQSDQPLIHRSILANAPQRTLPEMLPPGKYQLICSPAHPDLEKSFLAPWAQPAEVTYEGDLPSITVQGQTVPVYSRKNDITFTLPPASKGMFEFQTRVFSGGSPDSATTPYFKGRLQIISGWRGSTEEYIFSLRKQTEEK